MNAVIRKGHMQVLRLVSHLTNPHCSCSLNLTVCPQSFFFPLGVPKTPASTQARMSCSELDDSFLPDGSITASCSNDGKWGPLDMSQCTFRKDAPVVAVAVVETPLAMMVSIPNFQHQYSQLCICIIYIPYGWNFGGDFILVDWRF